MKKLLILILIISTSGPVIGEVIPLLSFAIASTDFFNDLIILIKPTEPDYKLISITCTILVLLGSYTKIPKKWSY